MIKVQLGDEVITAALQLSSGAATRRNGNWGGEATLGIILQTIDEWIKMMEMESETLVCAPVPALTFGFPRGKYQSLLAV